jgi:2-methylisocitrate lyase-like PEP mutase family enzyme
MGYAKSPEGIYKNLQHLVDSGVVGINIEDSVINDGKRTLRSCDEFASLIVFLKRRLNEDQQSVFINVRCDTFLLNVNDKENETVKRLKLYESVGADGIFLPFIIEEKHIAQVVASTKLPLNVMVIPNLPSLDSLIELGVKRVSMGPFLQKKVYAQAKELAKKIINQHSIKSII